MHYGTRSIQRTSTHESLGFTLIELLVVIVIIAILAAILFPVFATARDKARQTSCASNMKQLGLAFVEYEQDFDEIYPNGNAGNYPGDGWAAEMFPYVKSTQAYACPSDLTPPISGVSLVSYFYNGNLTSAHSYTQPYTNNPGPLMTESLLNAPALTVLLWETTDYRTNLFNPNEAISCASNAWDNGDCRNAPASGPLDYIGPNYPGFGSPQSTTGRHAGGSNWCACDGHIIWLMGTRVSPGRTADSVTQCGVSSNPTRAMGTGCPTMVSLTFSPK